MKINDKTGITITDEATNNWIHVTKWPQPIYERHNQSSYNDKTGITMELIFKKTHDAKNNGTHVTKGSHPHL